MSAVTWNRPVTAARPLPLRTRVRHVVDTVRWAPAPYFEGSVRQRVRYVAYLLGSVLAWTVGSLAVLAVIGRALASV
ncbi:chemotaxis protein CheW [Cellulomonas sp. KH9]|uniref:chemotaxis protein CheW n=1 Tax=Cellulomonas sp. KH9 TaxID=1855324 RepID=UPI0008F29865|nr:chemotaxis protein CheW [Cellulomonas sp. KH9]SFK12661.1 hypothetical protein SAMN05216467_2068 [Cellulomonas sp. KH9]